MARILQVDRSLSNVHPRCAPLSPLRRQNPRVLLVEDNAILARAVKGVLELLGCTVVGPANTVESGMDLATTAEFDAALLDVSIGDDDSFAIATELRARGRPFMFTTGFLSRELPAAWRQVPILSKPVFMADLKRGLEELLDLADAE